MAERKPHLETCEVDPYTVWDPLTREIIATVQKDPAFKNGDDPRALFFARIFAASYEMYVELDTLVLAKKKDMLQYWDGKSAEKIVNEIKGGGK